VVHYHIFLSDSLLYIPSWLTRINADLYSRNPFCNTPKEISAMAALKRTATRDLHFKEFFRHLEAFAISVNYCFSTKLKILNHKNGSFYLKNYCNAMVTLNLPINQQLVDFCNILDKNEITADILLCCQ
jgi:hypothetical protein